MTGNLSLRREKIQMMKWMSNLKPSGESGYEDGDEVNLVPWLSTEVRATAG